MNERVMTEESLEKQRSSEAKLKHLEISDRCSRSGESQMKSRRTSRGSQRCVHVSSEDDLHDASCEDRNTEGSRKTSPQVTCSSHVISHTRDVCSVEEDCSCVTLDPVEHEWMMCSSDGDWNALQTLLRCEPTLVQKKDFITGFTCLHWAAKQGKPELLATLVNFANQHEVSVNLNARSSAGYTPLHLAAIHNHVEVMKLLVGAYDVDVDVRDYNGKKAAQYLRPTVTGDMKDMIGACESSDTDSGSGAGRWRLPKVLPSNLNPLRLLNPTEESEVKPHVLYRKSSFGRIRLQRNRFKTQIVHSTSFRENEERDDGLESSGKTRPVSNLFG